jgi:hypothetical protein
MEPYLFLFGLIQLLYFSALSVLLADIPVRGSDHLCPAACCPLRRPPLSLLLTHPPGHTR